MPFTPGDVRFLDITEWPRIGDVPYAAVRLSNDRQGHVYVTGDDEVWLPRLDEQWIADRLNALEPGLGGKVVEARLLATYGERLRPI